MCVSLLDRLENDQLDISQQTLLEFQERPFDIVGEYMKKQIKSELKEI